MSSIEETKGIRVVFIIEVLGRPPEHLNETLEKLIEDMGKEEGVNVKWKKINKPVLMKDQKDFYTNFAEVEIEVEEVMHLTMLVFKYMPAHVEIISPELIALTNSGWAEILNELTRRLHAYDEVTRISEVERNILEKRLKEILEEKKE